MFPTSACRQTIPAQEPACHRGLRMDYIVVEWEVPEDDGGEPITGYTVERRNAEKQTWIKVGEVDADTLTIKATKLTKAHRYYFHVVAENCRCQ